ncbi:signal peptide containing protein [Cryptosporidium canis]|uniref:Signal peptide containing protein n=1 Tax=Cryptosporidium canis TaxID=195482 RepID=A0A9D5DK97_9CRYT|nr:signal peptide containing protein [Cryptosporidium canis]
MRLYLPLFILVLSGILTEGPIIAGISLLVQSASSNRDTRAESGTSGKKPGGFFGKLLRMFGKNSAPNQSRNEDVPVKLFPSRGSFSESEQEQSGSVESESPRFTFNRKFESLEGSYYDPSNMSGVEIEQYQDGSTSEGSTSAPVLQLDQAPESSEPMQGSEQTTGQTFISMYDDDYNDVTARGVELVTEMPEESEKSKAYETHDGGLEIPEQSEPHEESGDIGLIETSEPTSFREATPQETSPHDVSSLHAFPTVVPPEETVEVQYEHSKPIPASSEDTHYDASYESKIEDMEKSISEYRAKYSDSSSDELPHETYDRLLNEALNNEQRASSIPDAESSHVVENNLESENVEKSERSVKGETTGIEKYLEESSEAEGTKTEASNSKENETIDLNESSARYSSQRIGEEPEELEEFLIGADIRAPVDSEHSEKSGVDTEIPSENSIEKSMKEMESMYEHETEQPSEQEQEIEPVAAKSEQAEEDSRDSEEGSIKPENSAGFMSRASNAFRNFISSFGNSNKDSSVESSRESSKGASGEASLEPSVSLQEASKPAYSDEIHQSAVEGSESEENAEESMNMQDTNKSRVKMLIERFEKENMRSAPTPIGVPKNKLGLRDTEGGAKKNIDSLINFFESEDIRAKEEARKSQESKLKREESKSENSIPLFNVAPEEDLAESQQERMYSEETPESGEEKEIEIMRSINGESSSMESEIEAEKSRSVRAFSEEGSQKELDLSFMLPGIEERNGLAGGFMWALGVGKHVCNLKSPLAKATFPVLANNVLVSAPSEEQILKLLQLSGNKVSESIMDLLLSAINQN